jgi:hypothetical protein
MRSGSGSVLLLLPRKTARCGVILENTS